MEGRIASAKGMFRNKSNMIIAGCSYHTAKPFKKPSWGAPGA